MTAIVVTARDSAGQVASAQLQAIVTPPSDYPPLVASMGLKAVWDYAPGRPSQKGLTVQPDKKPSTHASQLPGGSGTLSNGIIRPPAGRLSSYEGWDMTGLIMEIMGQGTIANLVNTRLGGPGLPYYVKGGQGAKIVCDRIEYDGQGRNRNYAGGFYLTGGGNCDLSVINSNLKRDALNFMVRAGTAGQTVVLDSWVGPGLWQNPVGDTSHFELHHTFSTTGEVLIWERVFHDGRGWQGGTKKAVVTGYLYMEGTNLNWRINDSIFLGFGNTADASGLETYYAFQMGGSGRLLITNNIIQQDTSGNTRTFHTAGVTVDLGSVNNRRWRDGSLIVEEGLH